MTDMSAATGSEAADADGCVRRVLVTNQLGIHARPASQIAREAQAFSASVSLATQEQTVDAKSILDVLTLAAGPGCAVEIRAEGDDAQAAVEKIAQLFAAKFGEK